MHEMSNIGSNQYVYAHCIQVVASCFFTVLPPSNVYSFFRPIHALTKKHTTCYYLMNDIIPNDDDIFDPSIKEAFRFFYQRV